MMMTTKTTINSSEEVARSGPLPDKHKSEAGMTLMEVVLAFALIGFLFLVSIQVAIITNRNLQSAVRQADTDIVKSYLRNFAMNSTAQVSWKGFDPSRSYQLSGNNIVSIGTTPQGSAILELTDPRSIAASSSSFLQPFVQSAFSAGDSLQVKMDSHTLLNYRLRTDSGGALSKEAAYIIASRCVPNDSDRLSERKDTIDDKNPELSAAYVLGVLDRAPSVRTVAGELNVQCCPLGSPNCTDGDLKNWLARTFIVNVGVGTRVTGIIEIPSPEEKSVWASGMMLLFEKSSGSVPDYFKTHYFVMKNSCLTRVNFADKQCVEMLPGGPTTGAEFQDFATAFDKDMNLEGFQWTGQVTNPLEHTGIINLGL